MFKEILIIAGIVAAVFVGYNVVQNGGDIWATLGGLTDSVSNIATENPLLTTAAALGGPTVVGAVAKQAYSSLKQQKDEQINDMTNFIANKNDEVMQLTTGYETRIEGLKAEVEQLKQENPETDLLKNQLAEAESTINNRDSQIQGLQDMHQNFVAKLTSGTDTVIDPATNQIYKVIKITETQVL